MPKRKVSLPRTAFVFGAIAAGVIGGYFLGDAIREAEKPSEYIAVIFSILAASLFAVISIVGDPGMLTSGAAANAWVNAREIQKELHRFNLLFYAYLITLGLLVASEVIEHAKWASWFWVTKLFAGFAISSFILSFALPLDFMRLQRRRLEQEIAARTKRKSRDAVATR